MATFIGWILLIGGTVTFIASLANNSLWIYWLRFLALGTGVLGFALLKTNGAL